MPDEIVLYEPKFETKMNMIVLCMAYCLVVLGLCKIKTLFHLFDVCVVCNKRIFFKAKKKIMLDNY